MFPLSLGATNFWSKVSAPYCKTDTNPSKSNLAAMYCLGLTQALTTLRALNLEPLITMVTVASRGVGSGHGGCGADQHRYQTLLPHFGPTC